MQEVNNRRTKRIPGIKWALFLYITGLSETLGLISITVSGTAEIRLRDFIFFLPLIDLILNYKTVIRGIRNFKRSSPFSFFITVFLSFSFLISFFTGLIRGNPLALLLGDFRGILFLLLGVASSFIIIDNVPSYFNSKKLIGYCLLAGVMLLFQMLVLRDKFTLFNFHQDVYTNFEEGFGGRYILPLGGVVFISLGVVLLCELLIRKRRILYFLISLLLLLAIYGTQSRSLFLELFFLTLVVCVIYIYKQKRFLFYAGCFLLVVTTSIFLFFKNDSNNDNRTFTVANRELPTLDFFTDPDAYQSALPETYDRLYQHIDAYDYINKTSTLATGAGLGVMYRNPTWDYEVIAPNLKVKNYLTFSDGGFPFVLAKQGYLGLLLMILFFIAVISASLKAIKSAVANWNKVEINIAVMALFCILIFPVANPFYANDFGFFFGLSTTLSLLIAPKHVQTLKYNSFHV